MNLKEQTYVCALADTGSLTLAAKRLFISQPALSLYISNLEKLLGTPLFERIGKRFVLTYAGELYVERARKMLQMKDTFDIELSGLIRGNHDRLRIGIQDIRSHLLAPSVIPQFCDMYPDVNLIWREGNYHQLEEDLKNNQLDLFFCNCLLSNKDFEYIPILNDQMVFLTSKDNPHSGEFCRKPMHPFPWIDLKLFKDDRFILLGEGQSLRHYSNQILRDCELHPDNIFLMKKIFIMLNLINRGFGVGFSLLSYLDKNKTETGQIKIFSVGSAPLTATFYAVYRKDKKLSPYAASTVTMLKEFFTGTQKNGWEDGKDERYGRKGVPPNGQTDIQI